jgi:membrane protein
VVGVAGVVFGRAAAGGQLAWEIHGVVGWDGARWIQTIIHAAAHPRAGVLAAFLSLLTVAFGASSVAVELRSSLNAIWHVPSPVNTSGLKAILELGKQRFYSFALVAGAGVVLLVSVAVTTWGAALGRHLGGRTVGSPGPIVLPWLHGAAVLVSYLVITALFAAIYRVAPDVRLDWGDVTVGAAVTALVFTIGKQLIALYLGRAAFSSTYGAAGSLVVLLVWVYYSAQLFFLGAEFTKVYARIYGSHAAAS